MEPRRIHVLAPSIAERIAAGEVIERPASVVKELIENSLDAGATEIQIRLEEGGKKLIEILDNGHGMAPEDLKLCVERHATSKLRDLDDLEKIRTLGFRGEALPSVAAVSDLNLISKTLTSDTAYEINIGEITHRSPLKPEPKKVTFGHFIHSPHGTRIQARGLFSQIPARLKFLRSQSAEVSQVREWVERLALAYPQVGFLVIHEDRTLLNFRPESEEERFRSVLSEGDNFPIITAKNDQDGFRDVGLQVHIHWLQGSSFPQSRKLIQIVNSRAVRDRLLQQAILTPFRQALLPGQFPAVLLRIEIHPAALDVNVHPSKTELRFLDSRKIFSTVETLIKTMLAKNGAPAIAPTFFPPPLHPSSLGQSSSSGYNPFENRGSYPYPNGSSPSLWQASDKKFFPQRESQSPQQNTSTPPLFSNSADPLKFSRYVGILFHTYVVYEQAHELILIDQHAAHERIRYEKLQKRVLGPSTNSPLASQALLLPEVIRIPAESRHLVEARLDWLTRFGFEVEIFGEDALVFRGTPPEWGTQQLKPRLRNLVDRLLSMNRENEEQTPLNDSFLLDEGLFEKLASEACHSAVRAGDSLEIEEVENLAAELFQCEHPWNCPHGRPTVVKIPVGKFEEWFQRIV